MEQTNCLNCENTSCLSRNNYSSEWLEKIWCKSGQHIFLEDMPVKGLYIVQKGTVKEYYIDKKGNEKTIHTATKGEVFGHRDYSYNKHMFRAIAIEDTHICFFNKNSLYEAFLSNSELSNNLRIFFSDELRKADNRHKIYLNTL